MFAERRDQIHPSERRPKKLSLPAALSEFVETARYLRASKELILRTWENRVRASLPSAQNSTRFALYDALPRLLDRMAITLEVVEPLEQFIQVNARVAQEHGEQRAEASQFSLEEI